MGKLKAFVGHSFNPKDEHLIQKFLKYFNQVRESLFGFSWEHAEAAEPKDLAEKVLRLMKDKNLFIGICTKKEVVIDRDHLRTSGIFGKKELKAEEEKYSWKTSDWIIQEIGLAIGREMKLILLVENGLRQPGGLQGNLENIPFDRDTPEKSFGKILEMLTALMPKIKELPIEEADSRSIQEEKAYEEEPIEKEYTEPKESWTQKDYRNALFHMILTDNEEGVTRIGSSYCDSVEGKIPENRLKWEAFQEYIQIISDKGGSLKKLEEIAKTNPEDGEIQSYLAWAYEKYEEYSTAAKYFEVAGEKAKTDEERLKKYKKSSIAYAKAGQQDKVKIVTNKMKNITERVSNGETILIETLCEVAEIIQNEDSVFGLRERLLFLHPDKTESRFSLAYAYSSAGQEDLALLHYLRIPNDVRVPGTWNNLGVQYEHFDLQNMSVIAYRKAEALDETLAMSNLANKFLRSGFLDEAETVCNRALKIENYNKNIGLALSRIKEIPEEEKKKEEELKKNATPRSEFYKDFGHALTGVLSGPLPGDWQGPQGKISATIEDETFLGTGRYEVSNFLGLLLQGREERASTKYLVKYEGQIEGLTIKGTVSEEVENEGPKIGSAALSSNKPREVLMIISKDLSEIRVYEKKAMSFYSLKRIS